LEHLQRLPGFAAMAKLSALLAALSVTDAARVGRSKRNFNQCGVKGSTSSLVDQPGIAIVNGQDADFGEWRWQVGLRSSASGLPFCGGMLIDAQWVLTAAHCLVGASRVNVLAGDYDIGSEGDAGEQTLFGTPYSHPDYNQGTFEWDFALIRLDQPFELNENVGTVCLPTQGNDVQGGESCQITGWGTLSSGGGRPRILQEAPVATLSNQACRATGYGASQITSDMLCAQGRLSNGSITDACQGDSGGPLVCNIEGQWAVYGATSWGRGCAGANYPGVWARVHEALGWIDSVVNAPTPAPTPAPPPGTWTVTGTGCTAIGDCIQSNNHPSNYGNNEACSIAASEVAIRVDAFSTESRYDFLTMSDGVAYSGNSGPPSGTYSGVITWASDYSVVSSGWKLCKA